MLWEYVKGNVHRFPIGPKGSISVIIRHAVPTHDTRIIFPIAMFTFIHFFKRINFLPMTLSLCALRSIPGFRLHLRA